MVQANVVQVGLQAFLRDREVLALLELPAIAPPKREQLRFK